MNKGTVKNYYGTVYSIPNEAEMIYDYVREGIDNALYKGDEYD